MIGAMMFFKGLGTAPEWIMEEFNLDPFMEQLNKQGFTLARGILMLILNPKKKVMKEEIKPRVPRHKRTHAEEIRVGWLQREKLVLYLPEKTILRAAPTRRAT